MAYFLFSFLLFPFSFPSVSAQKSMNVRVIGLAQGFVRAAENNLTVANHQNFTVNQTQLFAFLLRVDLTGFIDHSVLRSMVIMLVHIMRVDNRTYALQLALLY